jgi:hypothetical protein
MQVVTEAGMSHVTDDKIEAAYRRTHFYVKRTKLMQTWADYVTVLINGSLTD